MKSNYPEPTSCLETVVAARERRSRRAMVTAAALLTLIALFLVICVPVVRALEPPRPGELAQLEREGKLEQALRHARALGNYKLDPALLKYAVNKAQRAQLGLLAPSLTPPGSWAGMPTTGNVKILTLLIDFSDYPAYNTAATIDAKLFGGGVDAGDFPYESLHNYYARSSYDQLDLTGDVLGWYRPAYTRASLGSLSDTARETLIAEALNYYDPSHDFSQYDNNGDGKIDYFVVVWTGPDEGWSSNWWGYQTSWGSTTSPTLDGKTLAKYSWQWECRYDGGTTDGIYDQVVVMHETGHALGLPDYYDYQSKADGDTIGPDGGVGQMDMMDANWGDHNSFSKWVLDWITPQVVTGAPQSVTLAASGTSRQALVAMPGASSANPFAEFFIVENRERTGNNSDRASNANYNLPTDGLLVWHVDARLNAASTDYLYDNSYTAHKLLRLMEADGLNEIETVPGYWVQASDYYTSGKTLTDASNPNSKKYDGAASNVVVQSIPAAGASMTFTAGVSGGAATDVTAPVTTASGFDGAWHRTPVTITFSATDPPPNASGVAYTEYKLDSGSWTHGTSVTVPAPANVTITHTVLYRSADNAGNLESYKSGQVKIDTTTPTDVTAPVTTASGNDDLWHNRDVEVALSASDEAGGSGVASITGSFDGGAGQVVPGDSAVATFRAAADHSNDGVRTLSYWAIDNAGNREATKTLTVKIDTTGPRCAAKRLIMSRGQKKQLVFAVRDALSPKVTCTLKIKTRGGATKKSWVWSWDDVRPPGKWWYINYRCKLKRGTYFIVVTGKDLAGNRASVTGRAKLIVR
jgi:M6 family metalloprotease-like protein